MTIDGMIYRQRVIVCRFSRESGEEWRKGQILCLVKQTNSIIQSSHSSSTSVYVSVVL